jgi:hypothetical protein
MSILPKTLLRLSETAEVKLPAIPRLNFRAAWGWTVRGIRLLWLAPFYVAGWAAGIVVGAGLLAIAGMIEGYKDGKRL